MKVYELIRCLQELPQDLDVICDRYSDYTLLEAPTVITALKSRGSLLRYYRNQWLAGRLEAAEPDTVQVCHFEGN